MADALRAARGRALPAVAAGLALLLLGLTLAGAFAWSRRVAWAEAWLREQVRARGVTEVALRVARLDLAGIAVRDVALGPGASLRVERLDVDWSPAGLLAARFDAVRVAGVRAELAAGPEGLEAGALGTLLAGGGGEGGAPALPAPVLALDDASARVATPRGPATIALTADVAEATGDEGGVEGRAELRVAHALGSARIDASVVGPLDALSGDLEAAITPSLPDVALDGPWRAAGRFSLGGEAATLALESEPVALDLAGTPLGPLEVALPAIAIDARLPAPGSPAGLDLTLEGATLTAADVLARRVDVEAHLGPGPGRAEAAPRDLRAVVRVDELVDRVEPPRVAPLSLTARAAGPPERLAVEVEAEDAHGVLPLRAQGWVDALAGEGTVSLRIGPVTFGPGPARPKVLFPAFGLGVRDASGEIEGRGTVHVGPAGPAGPTLAFTLALRELAGASDLARVDGVRGEIDLQGPPLASVGDLSVEIDRIDAGLVLTEGRLRFRLLPTPAGTAIDVPAARWEVADGRVLARTRLAPDALVWRAELDVEDVSLEALSERADVEGLRATGRLSGSLPVRIEAGSLWIDEGRLTGGPEGGTLRYAPGGSVEAAAAGRPRTLGYALRALEDFRWDDLAIGLDGEARGDMHFEVHLGGHNPEFEDGRRVELNLDLEVPLAPIVGGAGAAYGVQESIERRVQERTGGDASPADP